MASIHRRNDSKYWYCTFRIPVDPAENGGKRWKQVQRNTKQTDRKKAEKAAEEIEEATRREHGAGEEKSREMLAVLREATERAMQGTLSEALAREALIRIYRIVNESDLAVYSTRAWFDEWLERKKRTVKDGTYALYRGATDSFAKWLGERADNRMESLGPQDVRRWRDQLHDEGRTGKTVGQYQKAVSSAFRAAVAEGILLRNPADGLEYLPKEDSVKREPFSPEEVQALIEHACEQWALAIRVGYYTGLRLRDVANLRWKDVDLSDGGLIQVEPMKQARKKEHKKRLEIPMHPALASAFLEYPSSDDKEAFVFPDLAGRPTGGNGGLSHAFSALMEAASVDPMTQRVRKKGQKGREVSAKGFHSLRHNFVSALANSGVNPELRKELSGHDDSESHKIYTHLDRERMRNALEGMGEI